MVWEVELGSIVFEKRRAFFSGELKYLLPEISSSNFTITMVTRSGKLATCLKTSYIPVTGYLSANSNWLVLHVGSCCQLHVSTT